jgi:hypothetical protein
MLYGNTEGISHEIEANFLNSYLWCLWRNKKFIGAKLKTILNGIRDPGSQKLKS